MRAFRELQHVTAAGNFLLLRPGKREDKVLGISPPNPETLKHNTPNPVREQRDELFISSTYKQRFPQDSVCLMMPATLRKQGLLQIIALSGPEYCRPRAPDEYRSDKIMIWEFPKIRGTLFGVLIIRTLLFRVCTILGSLFALQSTFQVERGRKVPA